MSTEKSKPYDLTEASYCSMAVGECGVRREVIRLRANLIVKSIAKSYVVHQQLYK